MSPLFSCDFIDVVIVVVVVTSTGGSNLLGGGGPNVCQNIHTPAQNIEITRMQMKGAIIQKPKSSLFISSIIYVLNINFNSNWSDKDKSRELQFRNYCIHEWTQKLSNPLVIYIARDRVLSKKRIRVLIKLWLRVRRVYIQNGTDYTFSR